LRSRDNATGCQVFRRTLNGTSSVRFGTTMRCDYNSPEAPGLGKQVHEFGDFGVEIGFARDGVSDMADDEVAEMALQAVDGGLGGALGEAGLLGDGRVVVAGDVEVERLEMGGVALQLR